jgi:fluoroacetyl-CoA thioesterase
MTNDAPRLQPGLKHSTTTTVTADITPRHLRQDPVRVLATPEMVRLVEQTAVAALAPALGPEQQSVGTRIDLAHLAATPEGMAVVVTVEVVAVDRRRVSFKVEVHDEVEKVGEGTHERFIVDREPRLARLQAKAHRAAPGA